MNEIIETPNVTAKGLIKVELFDDVTGKKVEEVNTHNFIAQGVLRNFFNAKVDDVFTKNRATNQHEVSSVFSDPFSQISITDAKHPEEPTKEWLRQGKLIAYAYSDALYSGSDNLRGNYNSTESFTKDGHVRMVFDFPTNAANGEFRSIYFQPKSQGHNAYIAINKIEQLVNAISVMHYADKYYVLKSSKLEVYDINWKLLTTFESSTAFSYVSDFTIVDDVIYYAKTNGTDVIRKAPILEPTSTTVAYNAYNLSLSGIGYDKLKNEFVVFDLYNSKKDIIRLNRAFSEVNRISAIGVDTSLNIYSAPVNLVEDCTIIGSWSIDDKGNSLKIETEQIKGICDDIIYTSGHKFPKSYIGSRCLLDAPITKTNQQTMKITYDFVLPSIY